MSGSNSNKGEPRSPASRIQRGLEERVGWWDRLLDRPVLWALIAIVGISMLVLPRVGAGPPEWEPGDVASFDLVIPYDISLRDEAATEAARAEARESVVPVYDLEPRLRVDIEEQLHVFFAACRDALVEDEADLPAPGALTDFVETDPMLKIMESASCSEKLEEALVDVVDVTVRRNIVDDRRALERRGENGVMLRNLASGSERLVPLSTLSDAIDIRRDLEQVLRAELLERPAVARR